MYPQAPLLFEHRLIERMLARMKEEVARIQDAEEMDPAFIETAVDFIRVYADRTHEGKEETILFRELATRDLAPGHEAMMHTLIAEHRYARELTGSLVKARDAYVAGDREATGRVVSLLMSLTEFYPRHIAKEDDAFFPAAMDYFDDKEKNSLLERFRDFDRAMIHVKYESVVSAMEREPSPPAFSIHRPVAADEHRSALRAAGSAG